MTDMAANVWAAAYAEFGKDVAGMVAEVTARAAPQVLRLALIYAVLDNSTVIDVADARLGRCMTLPGALVSAPSSASTPSRYAR
jgi:hypothetical protein